MRLSVEKASFPWHRQPDAPNFAAAAAATRRVHGVTPGYTREGGSIPITQVCRRGVRRVPRDRASEMSV